MNGQKSSTICVCDICGKQFNKVQYLKQHLNIHSDKKPYSCSICNKSFLYQQSYKEHLQRHSKNKTVQCELCGKRFYNKRELEAHNKKHAQKGEYHCDRCGLSFTKESSLMSHCNRLHVSLYSCKFCNEKFSSKRLLKIHEFRQHRRENKNKRDLVKTMKMICPLCEKVLCNKWRLESHLILKHKMEKSVIFERGFLHFRGRNCKKQSSRIISTYDGENNGIENNRHTRNKTEGASSMARISKDTGSVSGSTNKELISKSDYRTSQNKFYDSCEETQLKRNELDDHHNVGEFNIGNKFSSHSGNTTLMTIDGQKDTSGLENQCSSIQYEKTISDVNVYDYSTNKSTDVIFKNAVGSESEFSNDICKLSENSHGSDPHATCLFGNDDHDSDNTCSVDLSESDSLVDDVTDSYEVLQHEFDEIPDTSESDELHLSETAIAVRPSSEDLQEYFAKYNGKLIDGNHVSSTRLRSATSFQVDADISRASDNETINGLGIDSHINNFAKNTIIGRNNSYSATSGKLGLRGNSYQSKNDVFRNRTNERCLGKFDNRLQCEKSKKKLNEKFLANSDIKESDTKLLPHTHSRKLYKLRPGNTDFQKQGVLNFNNATENGCGKLQDPHVMLSKRPDVIPRKNTNLREPGAVMHTDEVPLVNAKELNAARSTTITIIDPGTVSLTCTDLSQRPMDADDVVEDGKTEACFKYPLRPGSFLEKKRRPRLYSVKNAGLGKCKTEHVSHISISSSGKQDKVKRVVEHEDKDEGVVRSVLNNQPLFEYQAYKNRYTFCADQADCNVPVRKVRMQKPPLIFRKPEISSTIQNYLYTSSPTSNTRQVSNTIAACTPPSDTTLGTKPPSFETFTRVDKAAFDNSDMGLMGVTNSHPYFIYSKSSDQMVYPLNKCFSESPTTFPNTGSDKPVAYELTDILRECSSTLTGKPNVQLVSDQTNMHHHAIKSSSDSKKLPVCLQNIHEFATYSGITTVASSKTGNINTQQDFSTKLNLSRKFASGKEKCDFINKPRQNMSHFLSPLSREIVHADDEYVNEMNENDQSSQFSFVGKHLSAVPSELSFNGKKLRKGQESSVPRDFLKPTVVEHLSKFEKVSEENTKQSNTLVTKSVADAHDKSKIDTNTTRQQENVTLYTSPIKESGNKVNRKHESRASLELEAIKSSLKDSLKKIQHLSDYSNCLDELINMLHAEKIRNNEKTSAS